MKRSLVEHCHSMLEKHKMEETAQLTAGGCRETEEVDRSSDLPLSPPFSSAPSLSLSPLSPTLRSHSVNNPLPMRPIFSAFRRSAASSWTQAPLTQTPRLTPRLDSLCTRCRRQQIRLQSSRQMADDPRWLSVVDAPAQVVRTGGKHGPGLIILGIPQVSCTKDRANNCSQL